MLLFSKILALLWAVNLAPPLLAHLLENRWASPLDRGLLFLDQKPLLGPHKTVRGFAGGCAAGILLGLLLGFPWWAGFAAGFLSMTGDLLSSFVKRRASIPSGGLAPGLDQLIEGLLPFVILGPLFGLGGWTVFWLVILFSAGAYVGSLFLKRILQQKPFESYPRPLRMKVRLRELRSCEITGKPFHYILNLVDSLYYLLFMKLVFKCLGILEKGKRNALRIETKRVAIEFPDLPPGFDGYTILFLADLHLDGLEGLTEKLMPLLKEMPVDLCVLGGDLRMSTHGPSDRALSEVRRVLPAIRARDGILGVLGNHDCLEMVASLSKDGVNFLLNQAQAVERDEERIWIVGVDDPHYFQCHDLEAAFEEVAGGEFSILVAHSNEIYKEAETYAPRLFLCGHTHAGQIQLPKIGPVFTHSSAPREYCSGLWRYGRMRGYTSSGVGASGLPVRFFSRGEVTLITLRRGSAK